MICLYTGVPACLLPQSLPVVIKSKGESRSPASHNFLPIYLETWFLLSASPEAAGHTTPELMSASHLRNPRTPMDIPAAAQNSSKGAGKDLGGGSRGSLCKDGRLLPELLVCMGMGAPEAEDEGWVSGSH